MELNRTHYELETDSSFKGPEERAMDSWFLMSSIWPVVALTSAYFYFVVHAGPRLMKSRTPFSLKPVLLMYNLAQVVFSTWMVIKGVRETYGSFFNGACTPDILSYKTRYEIDSLIWYYLMSKYVEFLDTIFFILRGKWSQVTFLHVYHHMNMAVFTWIYAKYVNGIQIFLLALCNCLVHAAMYGYYLLSSFGPNVSRFLWWKRYITRMQIVQFLIVMLYMVWLQMHGCKTQPGLVWFTLFNTSTFLVLFTFFYVKAYTSKEKSH